MGYGTGAIMAVPAHDQRDFEFAHEFDLPLVAVIEPPDEWLVERTASADDATDWPDAYVGDGVAINSTNESLTLNGLRVDAAKQAMNDWLEANQLGCARDHLQAARLVVQPAALLGRTVPDRVRRARPRSRCRSRCCPLRSPSSRTSSPSRPTIPTRQPEPPLARATDWVEVTLDLDGPAWAGQGHGTLTYLRETNTMPQWAGSCWYYLRYLDPTNEDAMVDPSVEDEWAEGTRKTVNRRSASSISTSAASSTRCSTCCTRVSGTRCCYDLGHVSTPEPFQRLVNQGYILAPAFVDERGQYVEASEVEARDGEYFFDGKPVTREYGKMGKSLKNAVSPDDMYREYGADTLRLYEMFMGPLDKERPWNTSDIVGVHRFLQRLWRNLIDEDTGAIRVPTRRPTPRPFACCTAPSLPCAPTWRPMSFNTAIARLFELNNHLTTVVARDGATPRAVAEPLVLMVAPLAPHVAEELWARLGHDDTLAYEAFPVADESLLVEATVTVPIQVNGKVRARIEIAAGADDAAAHCGRTRRVAHRRVARRQNRS